MATQKRVEVDFTCYDCDTDNSKTVTVDLDEAHVLATRKISIEVDCDNCNKKNWVDAYV